MLEPKADRLFNQFPTVPTSDAALIMWQIRHQLPGRMRLWVPLLSVRSRYGTGLQSALMALPGVTQVRINQRAGAVIVRYHPTAVSMLEAKLPQLLGSSTKRAMSLAADASIPASLGLTAAIEVRDSPTASPSNDAWDSLRLPTLASGLAFLGRFPQLQIARPFASLTLIMAIWPTAQRAFQSIWQRHRLNIDCLDLLAVSLSAWQGKMLTPALVITLHALGDAIREQTARATEVRSTSLVDAIGRYAWVQTPEGAILQIPSQQVQIGDIVLVHVGEQIPVDGTVLSGAATVDQQGLTGEAMPIVAQPDSYVFASTLIRSGQLILRAERIGERTRAAEGLKLLQQAPVYYDTRMTNYAEKIADRLILPSLLLAGTVLALTRDPARTASILTLDFVTGIRISIPTAFLGALNHMTRHGVLVRSGRTLEKLAEVDTIVFDKTGTLTQGQIAIADICPVVDHWTPEQLLQLAATAEQQLVHPVAEAIVEYAQQQAIPLLHREHWDYQVGLGVTAQIDGHTVLVGSERFLQQAQVDWHSAAALLPQQHASIYVACDQQFIGTISYADPLRPESARLVNLLQNQLGLNLHLLTGDNPQRAHQVAQDLGIPPQQVYAQAFPEQKAKIVRDLHWAGQTVAFVGDGLNDSVALAYADVAVSFEQGADIARETADVVLMNNRLVDLLETIAIARQTRDLIDQNIGLVVLPNLAALGLASTVGLNPLVATIVHNGSAIAAGLNSLRPLLQHQYAPNSVIR